VSNSNKKICFTSPNYDFGSAKIRAAQVGSALGVASMPYSLDAVRQFDVIVYAKFPPSLNDMQQLNRAGKLQIIDPLDNFDFDDLKRRLPFTNGLIAASVSHEIALGRLANLPCRCIPHHHANFSERRIEIRDGPDLTLGYVGDARYWKYNKFITEITSNFFVDMEFHDLERSYLSLDIGIARRAMKQKTLFNSNVKLLNYMSYGVPSVVSPELSYLEVASQGEHCLFSEEEQFIESIEYLVKNSALRKKMSASAFLKAKDYHISRIAERYREYFKDFFNVAI
jgi:hypothetical protein